MPKSERSRSGDRSPRFPKNLLFLSLAGVILAAAGFPAWIFFPPGTPAQPADVVMVIAGESDGRHQLGAELIEAGAAPNFVVSNPSGIRDRVGTAHCRGARRPAAAVETWCLKPEPVTTTGEALTMGKLAEEQNWESATMVTNRPHARRVGAMFRHCTSLEVSVVYVDEIDREIIVDQVLHEMGGFIKLWLTDPC